MYSYRIFFSIVLLVSASFFLIPGEIIHQLSFHEDTCDAVYSCSGEEAISNQHHHCDILQLFISAYHLHPESRLPEGAIAFVRKSTGMASFVSAPVIRLFEIRGPPSSC